MANATNEQMQVYANERIRVRAEQFRALRIACQADKSVIDDEYARAASNEAWADSRLDGPPHLLQAGNGANPDDFLNYNAFISLFEKFMSGTFLDVNEANSAAAQWAVLNRACVRSV